MLKWETKSEINLSKFVIERSSDNKDYQHFGEVQGHGNSLTSSYYTFVDNKVEPGVYYYRLKMIDMDGTFKYSNFTEAKVDIPAAWSLSQNYPNPFNPATLIAYSVSYLSRVDLKVFNSLGEKVGEFDEGRSNLAFLGHFTKVPGYPDVDNNT
jgi:trimeric autotransporter adhesin